LILCGHPEIISVIFSWSFVNAGLPLLMWVCHIKLIDKMPCHRWRP